MEWNQLHFYHKTHKQEEVIKKDNRGISGLFAGNRKKQL